MIENQFQWNGSGEHVYTMAQHGFFVADSAVVTLEDKCFYFDPVYSVVGKDVHRVVMKPLIRQGRL